jgi:HD-like signal output (HDOD) protein
MRGRIERPEVTQDEDGDSVTHLLLKDELLDAQLLRTVGSAPYGGADVGECLATAARVTGVDLTSWYGGRTS